MLVFQILNKKLRAIKLDLKMPSYLDFAILRMSYLSQEGNKQAKDKSLSFSVSQPEYLTSH